MTSPLLTTKQVAERWDVSIHTVLRMVEVGTLTAAQKLPGLRGGFLFDPATIEALEAEEEQEADA